MVASKPNENLQCEQTAITRLRGASPSPMESASELENSPTANDCTSLALVDDAQGEFALLIEESQDCGVEAIFLYEGICSAASIAQNEFSSTSAIALS